MKPGQPSDREFDRKGDLLLNFFRAERGGHGVDLHLDRRGVWKRVDRELDHPVHTSSARDCKQQNDEHSILERNFDKAGQHGNSGLIVNTSRA